MYLTKINLKLGFTLVELIIVILIFSTLATISFLSFKDYPKYARDVKKASDLANIKKALTLYHLENGNYPKPKNVENSSNYTGWLEGELDETLTSKLGLSEIKNPQTNKNYTYLISQDNLMYSLETRKEMGGILSIGGIPKNCKDIRKFSILKDGRYNIFLDGNTPTEVYCDMTTAGGGWTSIFHGYPGEISKNNSAQITDIGPGISGSEIMIKYVNHKYTEKSKLTGKVTLTRKFSSYYIDLMNEIDSSNPQIEFDGGVKLVTNNMFFGYGNIWRVFGEPTYTNRYFRKIFIAEIFAALKGQTSEEAKGKIVQPCDWPTGKHGGDYGCLYNSYDNLDDTVKESISGLTLKKWQEVKVFLR